MRHNTQSCFLQQGTTTIGVMKGWMSLGIINKSLYTHELLLMTPIKESESEFISVICIPEWEIYSYEFASPPKFIGTYEVQPSVLLYVFIMVN